MLLLLQLLLCLHSFALYASEIFQASAAAAANLDFSSQRMPKDAYKQRLLPSPLPLSHSLAPPFSLAQMRVPTHRYTKALARQLTNHQSFGCLARTRRASFPCLKPHAPWPLHPARQPASFAAVACFVPLFGVTNNC